MKGYYIFAPMEAGCAGQFSGVEKKIRGQCRVLNKHFSVELKILPTPKPGTLLNKLTTRLPFFPVSDRKWMYHGEYNDADFLYIRQVRHDYSFLSYLRQIKNENPDVKIIYEVPTYPYENEVKTTLKNCHVALKDRSTCKKLKHYVDRIVTFYDQDRIFDIPTIRLINGFDFSSTVINSAAIAETSTVDIIEVATTAFWHGYDRFICGLGEYYRGGGQRNIVFHMVGDSLPDLVALVQKYELQDHVVFHGRQSGEALDEIYAQCTLAVDVLGGHRKDYPVSSSLKSREYAAKGLPVITSSPVDYIGDDYPYQLVVSYDDRPVDIQEVLSFCDRCYAEKPLDAVRAEIRAYAKSRCDINQTLLPVVGYLKTTENKE